jgi:hypothetical protein
MLGWDLGITCQVVRAGRELKELIAMHMINEIDL